MEIILTARDAKLFEAWQEYCGDLDNVSVYKGSILDVSCDAVVSPANSFGFMDGGIDLIYSQFFGWQVQERLQEIIKTKHHGELLIGSAEIVETDNIKIPYLISAPTMRVPQIIKESVNPYLAARAVFLLIKYSGFDFGVLKGEKIADAVQKVAFPGLGTGVGKIDFNTCAKQVRQAIEDVLLERDSFPRSWQEAQRNHQNLYSDTIKSYKDLQYE